MKLNKIFRCLSAAVLLTSFASCHNQEIIFPDSDAGVTAYFAYQHPVRTIVLGESETFDTSLDNQHKCIIYGAMGGAYKGKDLSIAIEVVDSLADNLYFDAEGKNPVKAMPKEYYTLSGDRLDYAGNYMGGVEVQLTDKFFEDPDAVKTTYVIPVVMKEVLKGDATILAGTPLVVTEDGELPVRTHPTGWSEAPLDYTLYAIKYKNPWDGSWLRRGVDQVTGQDAGTFVRHSQYVENDEVVRLTTESLSEVTLPVSANISKTTSTTIRSNFALHMANPAVQDANWAAQVWYTLAEPMKAGKKYTFKCKAAATEQYDWCSVFLQSTTADDQNYSHGMSFTTEWKETTMTITPDKDVYDKLTWCFGDKAITLMLDDVSLTMEGSDENLIANGDFENESCEGWSSWSGYESVKGGEGGIKEETTETVEVNAKTCNLKLAFDESGNCTVSSATEGITASGTGTYVKDGEKLAWGNKDRDGIYLNYEVDFGEKKYVVKDTLVSRSREVVREIYTPTYISNE